MILSREVDYPRWNQSLIQVRNPEFDLFALTPLQVVVKHFGKPLFEFKGNAFAHHADAIDRVDKRLSRGF
jgi:hypothetical protein